MSKTDEEVLREALRGSFVYHCADCPTAWYSSDPDDFADDAQSHAQDTGHQVSGRFIP